MYKAVGVELITSTFACHSLVLSMFVSALSCAECTSVASVHLHRSTVIL